MKRSLYKVLAILIAILLIGGVFAACGGKDDPTPPPPPPPTDKTDSGGPSTPVGYDGPVMKVRVVTMCPMTGTSARTGVLEEASISAAEQHMKEDNFLNPAYEIEFVRPFVDDESSTAVAPIAANLAISQNPHIVIGHHLTTMILISGPLFEEAQIPLIGIVSGPASVRQGFKWFHIGTVTDFDAAATLAEYLVKVKGFKKFLVVARNDEGGMAGAEAVIDSLTKNGAPFDNATQYMLFNTDETDFTAYALACKNLEVEACITYGLGAGNALILYDQIEMLYGPIPDTCFYAGSTSFAQPGMAEIFPPDKLQGIIFPTGYIQDPNNPFKERFKNQFKANDPDGMWPGDNNARVYDACWNIAAAINLLADNEGYLHPDNDANFRERLNYWFSQIEREGVQGPINYKAFDDGRCLAAGNVGEWQSTGEAIKVYPK